MVRMKSTTISKQQIKKVKRGKIMEIGQIVTLQPKSLSYQGDSLTLYQDEQLQILELTNSEVTFKRLSDGTTHTVPRASIEYLVE